LFIKLSKYSRKSVALLLALLLAFNLVGCSINNSVNAPDPDAAAVETQIPIQSTAPIETQSPAPAATLSGNLEMHVVDVGQADSTYILLPNGQTLLVDAGNPKDGDTVIAYLEAQHVSKIDYLIATHPHTDHIGGMAAVINHFEIGALFLPELKNDYKKPAAYTNMEAAKDKKSIPTITAFGGNILLEQDSLKLFFVAPNKTDYTDANDYSAVLHITYGDTAFLLTGDATKISENEILQKGFDIQSDVIKVGHHGSNSSSTKAFITAVKPKYAVISVGKGNSYGHPTPAILTMFNFLGENLYRTDESGTVIIISDGISIIDIICMVIRPNAPPGASQEDAQSAAPTITPKEDNAQNSVSSITVFITRTGAKYHKDGCRYLSQSKIATTLTDAKAKGYTPCSVCRPPQ